MEKLKEELIEKIHEWVTDPATYINNPIEAEKEINEIFESLQTQLEEKEKLAFQRKLKQVNHLNTIGILQTENKELKKWIESRIEEETGYGNFHKTEWEQFLTDSKNS